MNRLNISKHAPDGYDAVLALDAYVREHIDPVLLDLVMLRASQINGCAFCVDLHSTHLQKSGVPLRKIFAVSAWQETSFFGDRERAALALAEAITEVAGGVPDVVWAQAVEHFSERELSDLVLAIGTINLLNRMGVSTQLAPPPLATPSANE